MGAGQCCQAGSLGPRALGAWRALVDEPLRRVRWHGGSP
jgi:hypothetical protein